VADHFTLEAVEHCTAPRVEQIDEPLLVGLLLHLHDAFCVAGAAGLLRLAWFFLLTELLQK